MTLSELATALAANDNYPVIVTHRRSGLQYTVDSDQLSHDNGYIYGFTVKPHLRDNNDYRWFDIKNVTLANS